MKAMDAATLIVVGSNQAALDLAMSIGADHTVQVDKYGAFVGKVMKITQGKGAASVIDFVAEGGSTKTGVKMLRRAGNYYVVGYGEIWTCQLTASSRQRSILLRTWSAATMILRS
jgi:NAD+-dependent secondary alcohol dehydrogenase Adh1